jgi:hypothetical protein
MAFPMYIHKGENQPKKAFLNIFRLLNAQNTYQKLPMTASLSTRIEDAIIDFLFFCGLLLTNLTQQLFSDSEMESTQKTILTDIIPKAAARPIASNRALTNETLIDLHRKLIRWFVCKGSSGFWERKNFNEKSNYYSLFGQSDPYCAFGKQRISAVIHRIRRKPAYGW